MSARAAVLFLDTNILLDCPRPEDLAVPNRSITFVVIPEVMRELRGLARSGGRGQTGVAMQALGRLESLASRAGSAAGLPLARPNARIRVLGGAGGEGRADSFLVSRAKAEQARQKGVLVAVVTRDRGVADLARAERVKSILLYGNATASDLERGIAEHDTALDIDL